MWPVITPVQPGTGLGPVQAARDETADFAYQEGVWLRALLPSLQHGAVQTYINIFYFVQTVTVTGLA